MSPNAAAQMPQMTAEEATALCTAQLQDIQHRLKQAKALRDMESQLGKATDVLADQYPESPLADFLRAFAEYYHALAVYRHNTEVTSLDTAKDQHTAVLANIAEQTKPQGKSPIITP